MMNIDRSSLLTQLANGDVPDVVYGPNRECVASRISAILSGIIPTDSELALAAYGMSASCERKIAAYRRGREHLVSGYYEYSWVTDSLPAL